MIVQPVVTEEEARAKEREDEVAFERLRLRERKTALRKLGSRSRTHSQKQNAGHRTLTRYLIGSFLALCSFSSSLLLFFLVFHFFPLSSFVSEFRERKTAIPALKATTTVWMVLLMLMQVKFAVLVNLTSSTVSSLP